MNGWIEKPLSEIADITMGQSPDSKYYTEDEQGMSFIQGCAEFTSRYPMPKINCTQIKKVAKAGSILFSVRAPVGRINVADRDYVIGRGLASILAKDIAPGLLEKCLVFREPQFRVASQGSTFEAINSKELSGWPISFPMDPLEQQKIAELLGQFDHAIEQTEALIAKQQRIKTGLMQDLLTKGIGEHGNIRTEATHVFKDSPLGRIPVEWEVGPLRNYLSFLSYGFTNPMPEAGEGPYMVTAANVHGGKIDYDGCRRTEREAFDNLLTAKSRPRIGDVLITKDGTLGRIAVVNRSDVCINQSVAVLRFRGNISNQFGAMLLSSPIYQDLILADAGGSTIKHIYISKLDKLPLAVPSAVFEQTRILDLLANQGRAVTGAESELMKWRSVKNGLMHDLLTGERRVTTLLAQAATQ